MVDTFMSRDSDSPIIARELDAVHQWLTGDKIYHIMRDHPSHCWVILGGIYWLKPKLIAIVSLIFAYWLMEGCWGVKVNQNRSTIVDAALKMFRTNHRYQYDYDQKLLEWFVWPIAQENMVRITINWFLAFSSPYINIGAFEWIRLRMIVITVKKSDWASHFQRREKEVISSVGEQFLKGRFEFIVLYDVIHKTWRHLPIGIIVEIAFFNV